MSSSTGQVDLNQGARQPFVGLTAVPLARDTIAACALLLGLTLYWRDLTRGVDHPIIVVATIFALCGIALPYLTRARVLELPWTQDAYMRVWFVAPLLACCLADLVTDAIPGESWGIGVGMALSMAGAILAIWPKREFIAVLFAIIPPVVALASPLVAALAGDFTWQEILSTVLAALFVVLVWWLSAGRFLRGDPSAGVFLLALGLSVGLAMAVLGGSTQQPWIESVPHALPGLMLMPAVAAAAAPRVVQAYREQARLDAFRPDGTPIGDPLVGAKAQLWSGVVGKSLLVAVAYGLLTVVQGAIAASANWNSTYGLLRLASGLALAAVAYRCYRAFGTDRTTGYRAAVVGALAISLLGLLVVIGRSAAALPPSLEMLASLALPAVILCALLVPRCFAALRRDLLTRKLPVVDGETGSGLIETANGLTSGVVLDSLPLRTEVSTNSSTGTVVSDPVHAAGAAASEDAVTESEFSSSRSRRAARRAKASVRPQADADSAQVAQAVAPQVVAVIDDDEEPESAAEVFDQEEEAASQIDPAILTGPVLTGPRWTPQQAADPGTPLTDLQRIAREAPHLRPLVAANPSTYPGLLEWLAGLNDPDVDLALQRR